MSTECRVLRRYLLVYVTAAATVGKASMLLHGPQHKNAIAASANSDAPLSSGATSSVGEGVGATVVGAGVGARVGSTPHEAAQWQQPE